MPVLHYIQPPPPLSLPLPTSQCVSMTVAAHRYSVTLLLPCDSTGVFSVRIQLVQV